MGRRHGQSLRSSTPPARPATDSRTPTPTPGSSRCATAGSSPRMRFSTAWRSTSCGCAWRRRTRRPPVQPSLRPRRPWPGRPDTEPGSGGEHITGHPEPSPDPTPIPHPIRHRSRPSDPLAILVGAVVSGEAAGEFCARRTRGRVHFDGDVQGPDRSPRTWSPASRISPGWKSTATRAWVFAAGWRLALTNPIPTRRAGIWRAISRIGMGTPEKFSAVGLPRWLDVDGAPGKPVTRVRQQLLPARSFDARPLPSSGGPV